MKKKPKRAAEPESHVVYLCGIDWQHHVTGDTRGTSVFPSLDAITAARKCVSECGIVRARLVFEAWETPQQEFGRKK